jgi:DNA-binding NarL/FixJ family response regulator
MTLIDLYRNYAGSSATRPQLLAALQHDTPRRRKIVMQHSEGKSQRDIGAKLGITQGSVRSAVRLAMLAARKRIEGLPRYHEQGRPKGRGYGRRGQPQRSGLPQDRADRSAQKPY